MPSEPTRFDVPEGWQDWLIRLFVLQVAPFSGHDYSHNAINDLVRRSGTRSSTPLGIADPPSSFGPLTMPSTDAARAVAEELFRDPALDLTVAEWASRVLSSPNTVRRGFLTDTGLTFEQWRLRCRLSIAVHLLVTGYDVDHVAARVGFASRNGFTRAFKQQFGPTPHEFSRSLSARCADGDLRERASAARQADELVKKVQEGWVAPDPPESLPATWTTSHANDAHSLIWAYRGSGYLEIDDRRYEWGRGAAIWIPAGAEHVTGLARDSISLGIGHASTGQLRLTEPLQAQFSPAWDDYLMFCSISARSFLRPDGYDSSHVIDLFTEQLAAQRALSAPMPTDPSAHAVAMDYLRHVGVSGRSSALDVPAEIHKAFREQTGMSFPRWRYATRMRLARDLLAGGAKPSAVARRLGYGHLPNFSAAFTRFHGISPRGYQERETKQT